MFAASADIDSRLSTSCRRTHDDAAHPRSVPLQNHRRSRASEPRYKSAPRVRRRMVFESTVSACRISSRQERSCVPTPFNITKQPEFQRSVCRRLVHSFQRPHTIQDIPVLRHQPASHAQDSRPSVCLDLRRSRLRSSRSALPSTEQPRNGQPQDTRGICAALHFSVQKVRCVALCRGHCSFLSCGGQS